MENVREIKIGKMQPFDTIIFKSHYSVVTTRTAVHKLKETLNLLEVRFQLVGSARRQLLKESN